MKRQTSVIALAFLATSAGLAGCSTIQNALHHESDYRFDSVAALGSGWNGSAPWIPSDGSAIHVHESSDGLVSMLRVTASRPLASSCLQQPRLSAPAFDQPWAPDAYVETVWVCGNWDVIPTEDGYFGWTPIAPAESATPTLAP